MMTGADPSVNDLGPRPEPAPQDSFRPARFTELHETADQGGTPGTETPVPPGSGSAGARPQWAGPVRPAVWFQSTPEEAAPSGEPVLEPDRPDTTTPDADAPVGPWGGSIREPDEPEYAYLTPDDHGDDYDEDAYDEDP